MPTLATYNHSMHDFIPLVLGYLASVLLAISLLVSNDIRFRWLNSFGCVAFILYGISIDAFPVILTNSLLLCINLIYLIKIYRTTENFDLLEFEPKDLIIRKFLLFYKKDIKNYFPEYSIDETTNQIRFVVLRDLVIANIFAAHIDENGTAFVKINYTVEKFRDFKVGRFIFEKENKYLFEKGIKQIAYEKVSNKNHERFLKIMGFEKSVLNGRECYIKLLEK